MFEFKFADIGEGIHEGKLLKWFFEEGDEIKEGQDLFLVETDKVNAEIPSPVSGKVVKKMASVGDIIEVGQVIAKIDDGSGEAVEENEAESREVDSKDKKESLSEDEEETAGVVGEIEVSSEVIESSSETHQTKKSSKKKVLATPVARKLAKDLGIDINAIEGSGPAGRVMKDDIYKANETQKSSEKDVGSETRNNQENRDNALAYTSPVKIPEIDISGEVERVPVSMMRKTIAKNMVLSKSMIPHASTMDDIDITKLVEFRKEQKPLAEKQDVYLTFMPFIVKAVTIALQDYPVFNSSYDYKNEEIILKKYYNIGTAVDTPDGLMVPNIKDANKKGILQIAKEMDEIKEEARNRTISLDKLQNGTFTITNYGAVGAKYGIPVIKYPEVAILGVGAIEKRPVVVNGEITIRDIMPITLCIDHRVIDGGDAGRFLMRLKELLNDPMLLVLS
ncbi:MAG: 2-oxo acid dehydrogenase subunit E2 [Firmicutes bacterium]|nr:2-oxo acid dehydrogenase subunit E2 [Bacillota bacterium]MTI49890.1 2-oxo acid dehydrogenase subunit E2 [Bacillota bacterium]